MISYNGVYALSYLPTLAALSPRSAAIILSLIDQYGYLANWSLDGGTNEPLDQTQRDRVQADVDRTYSEVMLSTQLAIPMPYAGVMPLPPYLLEADGTTHLRSDYPALWDALHASLKTATDFTLPDMRGLVAMGASATYSNLTTGGEYDHTLTVSELASHSHTDTGHSHGESGAAPSVADFGTGAPVPSAVPSPSVTALGFASLTSTGSNTPHNNVQPYIALLWVFYAV